MSNVIENLENNKQLLETQIERLSASMEVFESSESPDGLEISEEGSWVSTDLRVDRTLANWAQLPDGVGTHQAWKYLVDSDWCSKHNYNKGIE